MKFQIDYFKKNPSKINMKIALEIVITVLYFSVKLSKPVIDVSSIIGLFRDTITLLRIFQCDFI